jgi:hypothetical protein
VDVCRVKVWGVRYVGIWGNLGKRYGGLWRCGVQVAWGREGAVVFFGFLLLCYSLGGGISAHDRVWLLG